MSDRLCVVCREAGAFVRSHPVMGGRFEATYLRCPGCDFLWVDRPEWLDVAYDDALATTDTGVLVRNDEFADSLTVLLGRHGKIGPRCLDVGGGYGVLVRTMRDRGFDFRWSDPHAPNLFARGYEDDGGRYDAVTAFEVIEHSPDPLRLVRDALDRTGADLFVYSTQQWDPAKTGGGAPPADWWYFAYASGQHISFLAPRTVQRMATELGMTAISAGGVHMFTSRRDLRSRRLRLELRSPIVKVLARRVRRTRSSLTQVDHDQQRTALEGGGPARSDR